MVNINISLTEEAYNYLKMLKGKDKSFSDVVIEMKENKCNKMKNKELLMKYCGVIDSSELDRLDKRTKEIREDLNRELNERVKKRLNDRARH
jgi:predicted CopG family antitoxin